MAEALERTQKERHENPRARGKFGGGRGTSGLVRNRRLVEPTREKNRGGGRGARITPARHATLEKDIYEKSERRKESGRISASRWWRHGDEREGWSRKRSE